MIAACTMALEDPKYTHTNLLAPRELGVHMLLGIIIGVVVWLACSGIVLFWISDIDRTDRHQTKYRWVRVTMVILGPVTIIGECIFFACALLWEQISIPDIIGNTRDALRSLWAK
jgi:hypothetical protein